MADHPCLSPWKGALIAPLVVFPLECAARLPPNPEALAVTFAALAVAGFCWTWVLGKIPGLVPADTALYGLFLGLCVSVPGAASEAVWWKLDALLVAERVVPAALGWPLASLAIARWGRAAACALPPR